MGGATSHRGVSRDNFNFESSRAQSCGIVNGAGENPKRTGNKDLLWFSVRY
jgi:hypothetical protein